MAWDACGSTSWRMSPIVAHSCTLPMMMRMVGCCWVPESVCFWMNSAHFTNCEQSKMMM